MPAPRGALTPRDETTEIARMVTDLNRIGPKIRTSAYASGEFISKAWSQRSGGAGSGTESLPPPPGGRSTQGGSTDTLPFDSECLRQNLEVPETVLSGSDSAPERVTDLVK